MILGVYRGTDTFNEQWFSNGNTFLIEYFPRVHLWKRANNEAIHRNDDWRAQWNGGRKRLMTNLNNKQSIINILLHYQITQFLPTHYILYVMFILSEFGNVIYF
jgi:hypothetical protein